jgi:hypothetical protein
MPAHCSNNPPSCRHGILRAIEGSLGLFAERVRDKCQEAPCASDVPCSCREWTMERLDTMAAEILTKA